MMVKCAYCNSIRSEERQCPGCGAAEVARVLNAVAAATVGKPKPLSFWRFVGAALVYRPENWLLRAGYLFTIAYFWAWGLLWCLPSHNLYVESLCSVGPITYERFPTCVWAMVLKTGTVILPAGMFGIWGVVQVWRLFANFCAWMEQWED